MAIKKISLCWVGVTDIERSRTFFKDVCGLELMEGSSVPDRWLEFSGKNNKGLLLGVAHVDTSQAGSSMQHKAGVNAVVTFTVDDIVAEKKSMEQKGVIFIGDIMEVPGVVKLATFVDPDNNTFQLVQELEKQHTCC